MDMLRLNNKIFIVIKPEFDNISNIIIEKFKSHGFAISKIRPKYLTISEAQRLYRVHQKEDFFKALCKYMSSGVSIGILLQHDFDIDIAFEKLNKLKKEIREKYSKSDMKNVIHSSEKFEDMQKECRIYF